MKPENENVTMTRKENLLAIMERQMNTYYEEASRYALSAIDTEDEQKAHNLKDAARQELARFNTMKLARGMVEANI
jgi:hypothetical protein